MPARLAPHALTAALEGNLAWSKGSVRLALLDAPPAATVGSYGDIRNELPGGHGYTTGGAELPDRAHYTLPARAWRLGWRGRSRYRVGDIIRARADTGVLYGCLAAGVTGGDSDTLDGASVQVGALTTDGSVEWLCLGAAVETWTSGPVEWPDAEFQAGGGVIYDGDSGRLLTLVDFGSTVTAYGPLTVAPAEGGWLITTN